MPDQRVERGTSVLRTAHRDSLVELLRTEGPRSRTELAEQLGLARSAVTTIVGELIDEGLLCEVDHPDDDLVAGGRPSRGRPRVRVGLEPGFTRVAAIQIGARWARVVLADAAGSIQAQRTVAVRDLDPAAVVARVTDEVAGLVDVHPGPSVTFVGVCVPGAVDASTGHVLRSEVLGWRDVPLADLIGERLAATVFVQDVTQAATLAEARFGAATGARCAVVADYGTRIGIGLVIDGRLHTGASGLAGSVGHTAVHGDTTPCRCGRVGCVEAIAGLRALVPPELQGELGPDAEAEAFADVLARLSVGDPHTVARVDEVLGRGAHLLATMVGLLDPEMLVVSGMIADLPDLSDRLIHQLELVLAPEHRDRVSLVRSTLGVDAWVRGAILVALQRVQPPRAKAIAP